MQYFILNRVTNTVVRLFKILPNKVKIKKNVPRNKLKYVSD